MSTVIGSGTLGKMDIVAQYTACFAQKTSTDWERIAPTGWYGWHVFATLDLWVLMSLSESKIILQT